MPNHPYDPDGEMTPLGSRSLAELSTPALAARYADAQDAIAAFAHDLRALRRFRERVRELDRAAARWRRRRLGSWSERRALRLERDAQRADVQRLTLEMRAETAHPDALFDVGDRKAPTWRALVQAAERIAQGVIWDVVATGDPTHIKSAAGERLARRPSRLDVRRLPTLRPDLPALRLENANGPDLWLYPGLLALAGPRRTPALVDLREVTLEAGAIRFVEEGPLPPGAHVVEQTWRYVNQDETPDRRFSNNPRSDVALYGRLSFQTERGLHEVFLTSDAPAALAFGEAFQAHRARLGADHAAGRA